MAFNDHPAIKLREDGNETRELKMVANPLLGMQNYQTQTAGLSLALPVIDHFISAHNLDSLLALERYFSHV